MTNQPCRALLVVPAANTTMAGEIAALCPWITRLDVARVPSPKAGIAGDLPGYLANTLEAVEPFRAASPDLVIFGCTAAGFYAGPEGNARTVAALRRLTGALVVSTADAMIEVLRHEKAARVALVTPYAADINARLTDYLGQAGIAVAALESFLCATAQELLAITEAQVAAKAHATDPQGAAALFIACSQMPTQAILPGLRERHGIPAWSSISATAWAAERAWAARRPAPGRRAALAGLAALGLAAPRIGRAQGAWPGTQPVSLVVPAQPGGVPDILGNVLVRALPERFGGSFVLEHRPGAATSLGTRHVARARPDGRTLLLGTGATFAILPYVMREPGFDPIADFAHVGVMANTLYLMVAHPRWSGLEEMIAAARREPGKISYATWGAGSTSHLGMVDFCGRLGIEMLHVPYTGVQPGLTDTLAGRVDVMLATFGPARAQVEAGRLRALGIPSERRAEAMPEVPTLIEQGHAGFTVAGWMSVSAPAGTPPPLVATLEEANIAAFSNPVTRTQLAALGLEAAPSTGAALRARIQADLAVYRELTRRAGLTPE